MLEIMVMPILAQLFTQPINIHTNAVSLLWVLPICFSISMVYKAIKLKTFTLAVFFREVFLLVGTIIGFLLLVAVVLLVISEFIRR